MRDTVLVASPFSSLSKDLFGKLLVNNNPVFNPISIEYINNSVVNAYDHTIETKYYSSKIRFCEFSDDRVIEDERALVLESVGPSCEGLILVPFFNSPEHNHAFVKWIEKWTAFIEEHSPSLLTCVVLDQTYQKLTNNEVQILQEWCSTNGIEFIREGETMDESEEEYVKTRVGIDRVWEALETTTWENMDYKTHARPGMDFLAKIDKLDGDEEDETLAQHTEKLHQLKIQTPNEEIEFSEFQSAPHIHNVDNNNNNNPATSENFRHLGNFIEKSKVELHPSPSEEDAAMDDNDFARALGALKGLRDQAKSLPDKERRELAASVVAMMFGIENWENDEEDEL
eukprot:TRINITY_DN537_c0_g1_i1.p1 TRINITY_DN537_c0_g1~~TRINITY_DN537_c0_g1_i1.p1  ORF type:complete len:342 (-),score=101.76 TRINITY_DN537_c0_g1_i1:994-2019(-)